MWLKVKNTDGLLAFRVSRPWRRSSLWIDELEVCSAGWKVRTRHLDGCLQNMVCGLTGGGRIYIYHISRRKLWIVLASRLLYCDPYI
jgi:hypothetical protein